MICNTDGCQNSFLDITGLCDPQDASTVITRYPYWMEMYVPETLVIPPQKPDMEDLNSVNIAVNILKTKVVKTPIPDSSNLEGKILTGRKLIVEGQLCQKIVYTANDDVQSVHSAHFYVPFSAYIVVPYSVTINGETLDSLDVDYQVNVCVEDLSVRQVDERTLSKNATLLLYAVPTQSC